jgi:hypothetical protein
MRFQCPTKRVGALWTYLRCRLAVAPSLSLKIGASGLEPALNGFATLQSLPVPKKMRPFPKSFVHLQRQIKRFQGSPPL